MPIPFAQYRVLFFCVAVLFITGVVDDLRELPPSAKFIAQLAVVLILVFIDGQVVRFIGDILNWGGPDDPQALGLAFLAVP